MLVIIFLIITLQRYNVHSFNNITILYKNDKIVLQHTMDDFFIVLDNYSGEISKLFLLLQRNEMTDNQTKRNRWNYIKILLQS